MRKAEEVRRQRGGSGEEEEVGAPSFDEEGGDQQPRSFAEEDQGEQESGSSQWGFLSRGQEQGWAADEQVMEQEPIRRDAGGERDGSSGGEQQWGENEDEGYGSPTLMAAAAAAASAATMADGRRPRRRNVRQRPMEAAKYDHLFGVYPVLYALRADQRKVLTLYMQARREGAPSKSQKEREEIIRLCEESGIPITETGRGRLDVLSENRPHQGLVLKCRQREIQSLFNMPTAAPGALWVALQGITDPQNMGSVLRSSMFFGCDGVMYEHRDSARLTPMVSKASAGAGELLPLYVTSSLKHILSYAKQAGWRVVGAESRAPEVEGAPQVETLESFLPELEEARRSGEGQGVLLVLGSEGKGLKPTVLQYCEKLLRIGGGDEELDSLNVGVAAGVMLHSLRSALGPSTMPAAASADAVEGPVAVTADAA